MQVDARYLEVATNTVGAILDGLRSMPDPEAAGAMLTTVLANVAGNISDAGWEKTRDSAAIPCETPGCKCEARRVALMDVLTLLRDDYKQAETNGVKPRALVTFEKPKPPTNGNN